MVRRNRPRRSTVPAPSDRRDPRSTRDQRRSRSALGATAIAVLAGSWVITSCSSGPPVPSDPTLAQGQQVFNKNCTSCHGTDAGGGIGPRLIGIGDRMTEEQEIAKITNGVPGTAMPAWGERLTPEEIAAVSAYVRSLTAPS